MKPSALVYAAAGAVGALVGVWVIVPPIVRPAVLAELRRRVRLHRP